MQLVLAGREQDTVCKTKAKGLKPKFLIWGKIRQTERAGSLIVLLNEKLKDRKCKTYGLPRSLGPGTEK